MACQSFFWRSSSSASHQPLLISFHIGFGIHETTGCDPIPWSMLGTPHTVLIPDPSFRPVTYSLYSEWFFLFLKDSASAHGNYNNVLS
ncbi:hypothetical protein BDW75DRAFT_220484 [Aspergillus navahoensis]